MHMIQLFCYAVRQPMAAMLSVESVKSGHLDLAQADSVGHIPKSTLLRDQKRPQQQDHGMA